MVISEDDAARDTQASCGYLAHPGSFRRLENDGIVHIYQIKGNSMTSLVMNPSAQSETHSGRDAPLVRNVGHWVECVLEALPFRSGKCHLFVANRACASRKPPTVFQPAGCSLYNRRDQKHTMPVS
jgi:hypothetical protein